MAKGPPLIEVAARGGWGLVAFVVRRNGNCPGKEFFDGLSVNAQDKFGVIFQSMAESGRVPLKRFKPEMDDFWAFRAEVNKVQIRFATFSDGNQWIITHGFEKKGDKWPAREINRARGLRDEYRARKREGDNG